VSRYKVSRWCPKKLGDYHIQADNLLHKTNTCCTKLLHSEIGMGFFSNLQAAIVYAST